MVTKRRSCVYLKFKIKLYKTKIYGFIKKIHYFFYHLFFFFFYNSFYIQQSCIKIKHNDTKYLKDYINVKTTLLHNAELSIHQKKKKEKVTWAPNQHDF